MTRASANGAPSALISACLGAFVFAWTAGLRVLDPREAGWVMLGGDWQTHFLGWHFFRNEAWHWPPGRITGFLEPMGTSLGYTDAIPLVAFVLKPFAIWLPNPFQFLGLWLMLCFSLQAFFGALVISNWTARRLLHVLGAMLFVFLPTLANRFGHPALCAHWLLLWALWLNWRVRANSGRDCVEHAAVGLTSGLVHPYLGVMVLSLLFALLWRRVGHREVARSRAVTAFFLGCSGVALGWWTAGLFTLPSIGDMTASGGTSSMNLMSLVNPGAIPSYFLPNFPAVSMLQLGEGYQYLGFGVLALSLVAVVLAFIARRSIGRSLPLLAVGIALAVYSVLPVIAVGRRVLVDVSDVQAFSLFRATGRFFWPLAYVTVAAAIGIVIRELRGTTASLVLSAALTLQLIDLHRWWLDIHNGARTEAFFAWETPLVSAEWHELLPRYRHMRLYYPEYCRGPVAAPMAAAAYLAGLHRLSINDGFAARVSSTRQREACQQFGDDFTRGSLDTQTIYLLPPALMAELQSRLGSAAHCLQIDGVGVCVANPSLSTHGTGSAGAPQS